VGVKYPPDRRTEIPVEIQVCSPIYHDPATSDPATYIGAVQINFVYHAMVLAIPAHTS
jgi:hypothetical protein